MLTAKPTNNKQDNLTQAQQEQIQADIAAAQPLVGLPEPPSVLEAEYKGASRPWVRLLSGAFGTRDGLTD